LAISAILPMCFPREWLPVHRASRRAPPQELLLCPGHSPSWAPPTQRSSVRTPRCLQSRLVHPSAPSLHSPGTLGVRTGATTHQCVNGSPSTVHPAEHLHSALYILLPRVTSSTVLSVHIRLVCNDFCPYSPSICAASVGITCTARAPLAIRTGATTHQCFPREWLPVHRTSRRAPPQRPVYIVASRHPVHRPIRVVPLLHQLIAVLPVLVAPLPECHATLVLCPHRSTRLG